MVILDTNIFLRYLIEPSTVELERQHDAAADLFDSLEADTVASVTEAVLAEVLYVVTSPKTYDVNVAEAIGLVRPLLDLRGLRLANKERVGLALDLYAQHPSLGFVDCLLAAQALQAGLPICSFDRHFDRIPGVRREEPDAHAMAA